MFCKQEAFRLEVSEMDKDWNVTSVSIFSQHCLGAYYMAICILILLLWTLNYVSNEFQSSLISGRELAFTIATCRRNSVCRLLSVTLVHPTQAVELFGNFFHHTIAQGLYFSGDKNRWWGRPFAPEICVQSDPPPLKQRDFDQYRLIAPQPW